MCVSQMDVIISSDLNYVAYLNFRSKQIHFPFLARWWERERKCQRKAQTITLFCFVSSDRRRKYEIGNQSIVFKHLMDSIMIM